MTELEFKIMRSGNIYPWERLPIVAKLRLEGFKAETGIIEAAVKDLRDSYPDCITIRWNYRGSQQGYYT